MKRLLPILLTFAVSASFAEDSKKPGIVVEKLSPNFTNYKIEGSLESKRPVNCVTLQQVTNTITPPDLFKGVGKCMQKEKFEKAAHLLFIARLFGIYDAKRVADKTAGQGIMILQMQAFSQVGSEKAKNFQEYVNNPKTKKIILASVCDHAETIGRPSYHPKYMILHGITAFTGIEGDGIEPDFEPDVAWADLLKRSCGEYS